MSPVPDLRQPSDGPARTSLVATALTPLEIDLIQLLAEQFQLNIGELLSDLVRRGLRESLKAQGLRALRLVPGGVS